MKKIQVILNAPKDIILLFAFAIFCTNGFAYTAELPIAISAQDGQAELTNRVSYFVDTKRNLLLTDILEVTDWKSSKDNSLNFGYNTDPHWLKFSVIGAPGTIQLKQLLVINYPVLDSIDIYFKSDSGEFEVVHAGDCYPFSSRKYPYRHFVIPFNVSDQSPTQFYIRVQTRSSAQIPLSLWNETAFAQYINRENYALGIYYGIFLVMYCAKAVSFHNERGICAEDLV